MRYRITWEGSDDDLIKLIKEHVKSNNDWQFLDGSEQAKIILEKVVRLHLTMGGLLESVTIKIEDLKDGDDNNRTDI